MAELIDTGSKVSEVFESVFMNIVNANIRSGAYVRYALNIQDGINATIFSSTCNAMEYLAFMDALHMELERHDIAVIVVYDYNNDVDTTYMYIVCHESGDYDIAD